jgi:hypothetical protein
VTHNHVQSTQVGRAASLEGPALANSAPNRAGASCCRSIGIDLRPASIASALSAALVASRHSLRRLGCLLAVSAVGPATRHASQEARRLSPPRATRTESIESNRDRTQRPIDINEWTLRKNSRTSYLALVDLLPNPRKSSIETSRPFPKTFEFLSGQRSTFAQNDGHSSKSHSRVQFTAFSPFAKGEPVNPQDDEAFRQVVPEKSQGANANSQSDVEKTQDDEAFRWVRPKITQDANAFGTQ